MSCRGVEGVKGVKSVSAHPRQGQCLGVYPAYCGRPPTPLSQLLKSRALAVKRSACKAKMNTFSTHTLLVNFAPRSRLLRCAWGEVEKLAEQHRARILDVPQVELDAERVLA